MENQINIKIKTGETDVKIEKEINGEIVTTIEKQPVYSTYILKQTFRAIMYFEELTKKSVSNADENVTDLITMFYCLLKAANKDSFKYTLDEFIELLDDNQEQIEVFNNYLLAQAQPQDKKKQKKT